jgi:hypothetical protein
VIGVQPRDMRLEVHEAVMQGAAVEKFRLSLQAYRPVDDFILVKAKPGAIYGVAAASFMLGQTIFGTRLSACGSVATFRGEAGRAVYCGTLHFSIDSPSIQSGAQQPLWGRPVVTFLGDVQVTENIDAARAYLAVHHPALVDVLEQGSVETLHLNGKCAV